MSSKFAREFCIKVWVSSEVELGLLFLEPVISHFGRLILFSVAEEMEVVAEGFGCFLLFIRGEFVDGPVEFKFFVCAFFHSVREGFLMTLSDNIFNTVLDVKTLD